MIETQPPEYVWHLTATDISEGKTDIPEHSSYARSISIYNNEKKLFHSREEAIEYIKSHLSTYYRTTPEKHRKNIDELYKLVKIDITKITDYNNIFLESQRTQQNNMAEQEEDEQTIRKKSKATRRTETV